MKIDDINSRSYYSRLLNTKVQFEAQGRVAWICQRVRGSTVLDIGCGKGIVSILLARAKRKVIGIDTDGDSIEYARKELTVESDSTREHLTLIHGDVLQQASEERSFDTVIIEQLIEYVPEPEALLDLARHLCKPNGRIIITTPFGLPEQPDYSRIFYLYSFAVLMSHFYELKELDVVSKCIAFSGEPREKPNTDNSKTQLLDQKWHQRIHELSEGQFEQLEMKHHIALLAHSTSVRVLQNKIADYKTEKQLLQSTIESLKIDKQTLKGKIENLKNDKQVLQEKIIRLRREHSQKMQAIRASATFRIGEALVVAARPSKATIALPLRLWRIYRDYKLKKPHP